MHSPSQLTAYLACNYLHILKLASKNNLVKEPYFKDPIVELLRKQGELHEKNHLEKLRKEHKNVVVLSRGNFQEQVDRTIAAMQAGADVIYQKALTDGEWLGYADFLVKRKTSSKLGDYSYIVEDTKLRAEVKGEALVQLCIYAELVGHVQGRLPDEIAIITGSNQRVAYQPAEFTAYLKYIKKKYLHSNPPDLQAALSAAPEPAEYCTICNWRGYCEDLWHTTDHLKLVAGSTRLQRTELRRQSIDTLARFAQLSTPPELNRGSRESVERIHKQAQIQLRGRQDKEPRHELILPIVPAQGLAALPEPSAGDIWFDIEGDVHIGELGLEYLFGWITHDTGKPHYDCAWAHNNSEERIAFERFIRLALQQREQFPDMHIYHYGHYEATVVRRLSTRYNVLVDEVDDLLRNEVFVDLNRVVKNGVRMSVESYGLKDIEAHYKFTRNTDLSAASRGRKAITLLLDAHHALADEIIRVVQDYNEEDCLSAYHLHRWLEALRDELVNGGTEVPRFVFEAEEREETEDSKALKELTAVSEELLKLIPADANELTNEQRAIKLLADLLLWYRREDKSHWWEYFRLKSLVADELLEERKGLAGPFVYKGEGQQIKQSKIYKWKFPAQQFEGSGTLHMCGDHNVSFEDYTIDVEKNFLEVKLGKKKADLVVPKMSAVQGLFESKHIKSTSKIKRVKELAEWVMQNKSVEGEGALRVGRNLLVKQENLPTENGTVRKNGECILECAIRVVKGLKPGSIFPIQGPPGTGKTYTAAHMICELIKAGKKVGVTSQSHSVVMNLLTTVGMVNEKKYHLAFKAVKQKRDDEDLSKYPKWLKPMESKEIETEPGVQLTGGTAFFWSREGMSAKVDVLFIDEAGQFSLADAVAVSHSCASMVMLGDPQQLENVVQGVHPSEVETSALGYLLGDKKVIESHRGLFLENTYRMSPPVNQFVSETFYEGKLQSTDGLDRQQIISNTPLNGAGLRFIPCKHEGNQSSSDEEVTLIKQLVDSLVQEGEWVDKTGGRLKITQNDVLIVAPYNAQVNRLKQALPDYNIGTVDKFQGKQAPIVIYSMATSSPEEAPRGMEFLYSLNRLNVAVSRAQCLAVIVASPALFELSCKTPEQMRLANAFCRFLELAN